MLRIIGFVFALLACVAPQSEYRIYLIMGQSNAIGIATPPAEQKMDARIIRMNTLGDWVEAREPASMYAENASSGGHSPSMAFALRMAEASGRRIAFINCAVPGTSITQWQRDGDYYQACLTYARGQRKGKIEGVLFIQGETDAMQKALAVQWQKQFTKFVRDFRADIGNKRLPFFVAELGYSPSAGFDYWNVVKIGQRRAARSMVNVFLVPTSDLLKYPDDVHYGGASIDALGVRLANKVLSVR